MAKGSHDWYFNSRFGIGISISGIFDRLPIGHSVPIRGVYYQSYLQVVMQRPLYAPAYCGLVQGQDGNSVGLGHPSY